MFERLFLTACLLLLSAAFEASANTAPTITSTPDATVTEDNRYEYIIVATDTDGDTLSYTVPVLPTFLTYNSSTQTISGIPNNTHVGSHNLRVEVSDGITTVSQQFSLQVLNANDAPTVLLNINNQTINEDETFTLNVGGNFTDEDAGDTLTFQASNLPSGLTLSTSGIISGAADNDAALASPFTVTVTAVDSAKASVTSTFQIVVVNINDAPEPFDDNVQVNEDTATDADILDNDVDVDNTIQPSTLFIVTQPTNGSVSINTTTGLLTYTPNPDYVGTDSLVYRISDPAGLNGTATVTFTVVNSNDPPVANNDVFIIEEDVATDLTILANDTDIDADDAPQGSQIIIELTPSNGSVDINGDAVRYVPNTNFVGTDTFYYKVADKNGAFSNVALVHVTVGAVNDVPVAGDDVAATLEDQSTYFVVLNNDSDTEDGTISVSGMNILNQPANGSVSIDVQGNMTYVPNPDFNGTDTFQYTVSDSDGLTSAAATVTVTVNPVNDAPQANSDLTEVDEDNSIEINLLGNDVDIDGNDEILPSSIDFQSQPSNGELFLDTATGIVRYTPAADFFGTDSFSYRITDSGGLTSDTANVQVLVNSVNDSPRLTSDGVTTDEDNAITISVLNNDTDVDGTLDSVTLTVTQQPVSGSVAINSSGQVTYTPNLNFHGSDQFSYNVSDNDGATSASDGTVLVTINSVNDAPVAAKGTSDTFEDKSTTITLIGTDVDEDALTYTILQQPAHGTLSGNGANRTYTPEENYNGADSFIFKANDGQLDSLSSIVVINVISVNDRPVATAQSVSVDEDNPLDITLTGTDIDGDSLTFALSGSELKGTVTGSPPNITYTPPENFNGEESLLFVANDGALDSARKAVSITINPVNDAPTVSDLSLFLTEDQSKELTLSASDIDEDALEYIIVDQPSHGSLSGTAPNLTYTPDENYAGTDQLTYKVNDGTTDSGTATVSIEIAATADAPVADAQAVTGEEDTPITITLTGSDPDGNDLTYQLVSSPSNGTVTGDDATIVYLPDENYFGNDSFQFKVSDGNFESDPQTVSISIAAVNDPPVAMDDSFERSMNAQTFVELDVLDNDSDIDGDALILQSASVDIGSVSINNNMLRYAPPNGFVGDVVMEYLMSDPLGDSDTALVRLQIINNSSANDPVITPPNDISIVATGRLTKVELGSATALDRQGNIIPVELFNSKTTFPPGAHSVFWRATDAQGNSAIASQKVNVFPLMSLVGGQTIEEGAMGTVTLKLNGPAPFYPLIVPYTVSGTATAGIDYELASGELRIDQGTEVSMTFQTFNDSINEDSETVIVSLADSPYKSEQSTYRGLIVEGNIAPRADFTVMQNGQKRRQIERNGQIVTVSAMIEDGNSSDSHTIEWTAQDPIERSNGSSQADFQFSALSLDAGIYSITAKITDSNNTPITVENDILIEVVDRLPSLGNNDSDGDLISDNDEGHVDSDGDNIPDYLDPNSDCAILPEQSGQYDSFVVEGESTGCLRLGRLAGSNDTGGTLIDTNAVTNDSESDIVGGLFEFEVHGLDANTNTYAVVLPQQQPIPENAVYRKYLQNGGWQTFVVDANNKIYSSQGNKGICPAPRAASWSEGLALGHWCVQLIIEDGGANDDDGKVNGMISDPGGVAVLNNGNTQPDAHNDFVQMTWNTTAEFSVLNNDEDPDGDALDVISVTANLGQAEIIQDRRILYTPLENFVGEDKVDYTISDRNGGIDSAVLTITVKGNSAPEANNDNASTTNDKTIVIDVLGNDTDADGDPLTIHSAQADSGTVAITADQKLRYEPATGFVGTVVVDYVVVDSKDAEDEGKLFISVTAPPVVEPTDPPTDNGGSDSGGGSFGWLLLMVIVCRRELVRARTRMFV